MKEKSLILLFLCAVFVLASCDTKTKAVDACGDSFVDPGEQCDTTVGENSCASLGHYNALGELRCTIDCQFDTTACGGRCGDEDVNGSDGEECDGANLNGNSCQSLGYGGGILGCNQLCQYEKSGCTNACGNGYREGEEACDDGNNREGDGCTDLCVIEEGWLCNDANPSRCTTVCLDGIVAGAEECDTTNLAGASCESLGYYGGTLECTFECAFRTDDCEANGRCGDDTIQAEFSEACDGADLAEQTCDSLGLGTGTLGCRTDCSDFDTSGCNQSTTCGDGTVQSANGELCDGDNLNGQTCITRGYYAGGTLVCNANCQSFNDASCQAAGRCGDGIIQTSYSEVCDGSNLNGETCVTRGFYGGALACSANCLSLIQTSCVTEGRCGDGIVQEGYGEECDGTNFNGDTCEDYTIGLPHGPLVCDSNCHVLTTNCRADFITMLDVPGGTFQRDATPTNLSAVSAFKMSETEVTRWQFLEVMGVDPSNAIASAGLFDPVQNVNWYNAISFCNKLSIREGMTPVYTVDGVDFSTLSFAEIPTGDNATWNAATANWAASGYRLPSEMEWMWAAMGADMENPGAVNTTGYLKTFAGSTGSNLIDDYVWYGSNSSGTTHPAGTKLPNELGIFDLSGNITEILWDIYGTIPNGMLMDYRGFDSGTSRVKRGGSRNNASSSCAIAYRATPYIPSIEDSQFGFRVAQKGDLCGDGTIQFAYEEQCDGANLEGNTCQTLGFYSGTTLACDETTCQFDTSMCDEYCGDGTIQAFGGEECEGADLVGETCASLGADGGTLACTNCKFDLRSCNLTSPNIGAFIYVPNGTFQRDAEPANLSVVSGFWISKYEFTRSQWVSVTGWADPSDTLYSSGTSDPVQNLNWYDAIAFCNKLSLLEGLTPVYTVSGVDFSTLTYAQVPGTSNATWNAVTANWGSNGYRLPTEMEWMWAAMGADTAIPGAVNTTGYAKAFAGSTGSNAIGDYAVFGYGTSDVGRTTTARTNPVAQKLANELGLYDLSGNVMELVWDWYASSYPIGTVTNDRGPASGTARARRGGNWNYTASYCTVAYRYFGNPYYRNSYYGFRVVRP